MTGMKERNMSEYHNKKPPFQDSNWKYVPAESTDIMKTFIKYGYIPVTGLPKYQS